MIRFESIISRIVILHVIVVAITSVLMSAALSWLLSVATSNIHNQAMQEQAVSLAEHLAPRADGTLALNLPPSLQGLYSQPYGRYAYAVIDENGKTLFSSRKDNTPIFHVDANGGTVQFLDTHIGDAAISGASIRRSVGGKTVWVQAAEDLANSDVLIDDIVDDFYRHVGWITLPILLVLLVIDIAIFRRALWPLRQASETAQQITPARTDIRLPFEEIPTEVRPLVSAINKALDRLDEGFRLQREFTADAAHELRTPLSILRTRVETLDDPGVAKALHQDIEAMSRVVSQLLDIAELEAFTIDPSEVADLQAASAEVAGFVAPLALEQGREIALLGATAPVFVKGNAEMIKRAIRNLAENAIRHAPKDTVVEFVVEENGTVSIQDRGPGISEEERELIFRRFWRRDRNSQGGSGLGLSIVQRIAELHGATIEVENRVMGGAQFSLHFIPASGPAKA
ncbi:ATP-binding protein [Bradyrhizobium erythrophlei]|uniref:histidine kinase n=1 Tax=Bradyrhizobium erythrophlei TaxID=1437360 RepID=A0A1M7UGD3_9BRAD|nr:ATP-binding protein [Bradyrhizobium erythrophlei]SHN81937.1 signal transduction histidine kinase [Bradyrhizobium erythrophlei]